MNTLAQNIKVKGKYTSAEPIEVLQPKNENMRVGRMQRLQREEKKKVKSKKIYNREGRKYAKKEGTGREYLQKIFISTFILKKKKDY